MSDRTYPLHEKLKAAGNKPTIIGEFLDFLDEQQIHLAQYSEHNDDLIFIRKTKAEIIGDFLGINAQELSKEKDRILADFLADKEGAP